MKKSNILIAALVAIIMILLAFIGVLVYKNFYDGKKNPLEEYYDNKCLAFGVQNANASKGQIVFIGDSITDLYLLDDHYADLPFACYNRGIGGDTTSGVLKRLKVSLFDITPKTVVLLIGTNDINGGVGDEVILSNYRQIIDEIFDNLPGVELYCVSIIPQNPQQVRHPAGHRAAVEHARQDQMRVLSLFLRHGEEHHADEQEEPA